MLSAFQLENNRLTRLEVEESQPLVNAVWIDLVEPTTTSDCAYT